MRDFILKYKEPFTQAQLVYDWPIKPVFIGVVSESLGELIREGKVICTGPGFGGHLYYEVVR